MLRNTFLALIYYIYLLCSFTKIKYITNFGPPCMDILFNNTLYDLLNYLGVLPNILKYVKSRKELFKHYMGNAEKHYMSGTNQARKRFRL